MPSTDTTNRNIDTINGTLWALHVGLGALALIACPLLLTGPSRAWLPLVLLVALLSNQMWALMHEGIHGHLFQDRRASRLGSRVLGIFFGAPFGMLRWGHLTHHQHNRTERERVEVSDGPPGLAAQALYFFNLLGGLYLSQLVVCLFFFLPAPWVRRLAGALFAEGSYEHAVIARCLGKDLGDIRVDQALIVGLYATSFALYGAEWRWLAALLLLRGLLISLLDYVYHYGSPLGDPRHGYNLRLPYPLSLFLLHFNLHGVHHRKPTRSWIELPALFRQQGLAYDADYLPQVGAQLRGVVPAAALVSAAREA